MKMDVSFSGRIGTRAKILVRKEFLKLLLRCPVGSRLMGHISDRGFEYSGTVFIRCGERQWAAHAVRSEPTELVFELVARLGRQVPMNMGVQTQKEIALARLRGIS